jgi:hypothetical protein
MANPKWDGPGEYTTAPAHYLPGIDGLSRLPMMPDTINTLSVET